MMLLPFILACEGFRRWKAEILVTEVVGRERVVREFRFRHCDGLRLREAETVR